MKTPPKVAALMALTLILSSACACGAARASAKARAVMVSRFVISSPDVYSYAVIARSPSTSSGARRQSSLVPRPDCFASPAMTCGYASLLRRRHALEQRDAAQQVDRAHQLIILVGAV